jgi:ribonucleoside-diphosphate reductase alpha chain
LEEPLPAGGSCLLGSLNLSEFVEKPFSYSDKSWSNLASFNYIDFVEAVKQATIALNEVLEEGINLLPLEEQKQSVNDYRQIGLGVMGLADMFIKMGIKYGSKESLEICDNISHYLLNTALSTSAMLAKEKGAYPKFNLEAIEASEFFEKNLDGSTKDLIRAYGLRNSQVLTCAPTGSLSTMLGISGGIEPLFSYSFNRRTQSIHGEDVTYKVHPLIVEQYMWANDIKDESKLPKFFTNAMLLDPKERIAMQAVWQNNIDASISSTINLPESTTIEEIMDIYIRAWIAGLKGITIYRDNCSRAGILTTKKEEPVKLVEQTIEEIKTLRRGEWSELPEDIVYYKRKLYTGCGKLNVFIGYSESDKRIHDLYAIRSGSGGCEKSVQTTIIAMAGMLRLGGNIFNIEKAFNGTGGCNSFLLQRAKGEKLSKGSSCGTAVLYEIKSFLAEKKADDAMMSATPTVRNVRQVKKSITEIHKEIFTKEEIKFLEKNGDLNYIQNFNKCPLCNEKLLHTDGCISCPSCSYSKCT